MGAKMTCPKRVFILGAGFSKPAEMPLAHELLEPLSQELELHMLDDMRVWLHGLIKRLAWFSGGDPQTNSFNFNIEQVFHYAHFDSEVYLLQQHLCSVGRGDGQTPAETARSIKAWLSYLEDALVNVILQKQDQAKLQPITRWAEHLSPHDAALTFNYDTLVEQSLAGLRKPWNHGTARSSDAEIAVYKLHGSIDWIVAHRLDSPSHMDLLFDKQNSNRRNGNTGHIEDDYKLWRCGSPDQLRNWISGRYLQSVPNGASPRMVGIAGLGAYKQLHTIPGLGCVWAHGMQSLYQADIAVVVGFSMSDFDAMAQMQFAEIAQQRQKEDRPLSVLVIDPKIDKSGVERFSRVFRHVEFIKTGHEHVDWANLRGSGIEKAEG
jgi:hypothetical protein